MSPRANVRSVDAVQLFKPAVIRFQGDLAAAITSLRTELNRSLQWFDHDCPAYWQQQVRMGFDRVAAARTELTRKSMITVAGHRADCIDEKKALEKAKRNLDMAQDKVRLVRQWGVKVHRAADEYNSKLGNIEQSLNQGIPQILVLLERMIAALELYASVEPSAAGLETREAAEPESAPPEPTLPESTLPESTLPESGQDAAKNASDSASETTSVPATGGPAPDTLPETGPEPTPKQEGTAAPGDPLLARSPS